MMVKPTVTELLEKIEDNRYSLVIMTSKRARQIASGDTVLTNAKDKSPVTLASTEIAEGKVMIKNDEEVVEEETQETEN